MTAIKHKNPYSNHFESPVDTTFQEASERQVMPARIAIEKGYYNPLGAANYWSKPYLCNDTESAPPEELKLMDCKNLLTKLSESISKTIQFPVNTIYAHGLGVVASAMSKAFSFDYGYTSKPVNLYVVTAQPPSTGKSGVNDILTEPVFEAFKTINDTAKVEIKKIKIKMMQLKKEIDDARKAGGAKEELFALQDEMTELTEQASKHIIYTYSADDPTPEGLAKLANKQNGLFNVISAEADAINIILGGVYSDKKANFGLFLKGWDAERMSVVRSGADNLEFKAIGNVAVIAQDESIRTILAAGESGRGISERFLLVREQTFLGQRNFDNQERLDDELYSKYSKMIFNIVREKGATLKFSRNTISLINEYRKKVEPEMSDNGKYSNNMMRGFIGKADKQIMKIASILHVIDNWVDGGKRSLTVSDKHVKASVRIFENIASAYTSAADELGFTGDLSEYKKVEEKILEFVDKGKQKVTISQLRDRIRGVKPFTGTPSLSGKLKDDILPRMELCRICILHEGIIYINPKLKG